MGLNIVTSLNAFLSDTPLVQASTTPAASSARSRRITVEPLAFFFSASVGAVATLQPQYIEERLAQDRNYTLVKDNGANGTCTSMNNSDPDYVIQQEIAADMATWSMVISALTYLPVVFLAPFYGVLSDRLGRRTTLYIPVVAHTVFCILLLLIVYLRLPLAVLVFANFIDGLGGYAFYLSSGCYAYISDISTEKSRLVRLAVLQTAEFIGVALVQVPVGYIIQGYGFVSTVWLVVALQMAAILYLIIPRILLETVDTNRNTKHIGAVELIHDLRNLFAVNTQSRRYRLVIIFTIYFFTDIIQLSTSATTLYGIYGLGPPFCWSSVIVGYFGVVFMSSGAFGE